MKHTFTTIVIIVACLLAQIIVLGVLFVLPLSSFERLLIIVCLLFILVGYYSHFFNSKPQNGKQQFFLWGIFSAMLAAGLTSFLVGLSKGNSVLSASIVGTALGCLPKNRISMLDKKIQLPAYTGVFVGMSSPTLFIHWSFSLLAGALAGAVFVWGEQSLSGVGGRLGTFAFISVCVVVFLQFVILQ